MSSVQQQTLITQVRQLFLALVDQEADDTQQTTLETVRSVLERTSTAYAREAAACEKVRQLDEESNNKPEPPVEGDAAQRQERSFSSSLWVDDQCEAAISQLSQVATMWQEIEADLLACGTIETSTIQYECLRQRRRITRLVLGIMDRQLAAERKRLALNGIAVAGGKIPTRREKEAQI
jgi:hypothetical protein